MHLVDEQNHVAVGLDLIHQSLDAAFELAAELRSGHQRGEVEQMDFFLAQAGRHIAFRNANGKSLRDRGFADAGLADQTGIVLCSAAQNLNHAGNLLIAAHNTVDLVVSGPLRQIGAVRIDIAALLLVFGLFVLRGLGRFPGGFRGGLIAAEHALNERERGRAAGHKAIAVTVAIAGGLRQSAHHLVELILHCLQLILCNAHLVHHVLYRLNPHLSGTFEAISSGILCVCTGGNKHNGRAFFAS